MLKRDTGSDSKERRTVLSVKARTKWNSMHKL